MLPAFSVQSDAEVIAQKEPEKIAIQAKRGRCYSAF
jgi:HJR/Mrr/RecB family endonuclease